MHNSATESGKTPDEKETAGALWNFGESFPLYLIIQIRPLLGRSVPASLSIFWLPKGSFLLYESLGVASALETIVYSIRNDKID